jgi:hypothetical protein
MASLIAFLVLLGGLIGVYAYLQGRGESTEAEATPAPASSFKLIDKKKWEVKSALFHSAEGDIEILPVITPQPEPSATADPEATPTPTPEPVVAWVIKGHEDAKVSTYNLDDMMRDAFTLDAAEKVAETISDPKEYRLDPPEAYGVFEYTDGTSVKVNIGMQTPAKDFYYMTVDGDPALYMTYTSTGADFFNTYDDLADKSIAAIDGTTLQYVNIGRKGKSPIEFAYNGTDEELASDIEQFGGVTLYMKSPYDGWELYANNFQTNVLEPMSGIVMNELVDIDAADLSKYRLDDPELDIWLKDSANEMHILVGGDAPSEDAEGADAAPASLAYAKFFDYPHVYTIDKKYLAGFANINTFTFTQRFIALINIDDCEGINITAPGKSFDIVIEHETITPTPAPAAASPDPSATPTPTPIPEKLIHPSVNGQAVQDEAFKDYYQTLIGLSYDTEVDSFEKSGEPLATISYDLAQGKDDVKISLYQYDQNFYAVEKDGAPIRFVISKQYVDLMFKTMDDLLAGRLDE